MRRPIATLLCRRVPCRAAALLLATALGVVLLASGPARAYDLALIVGNEDYRHLSDVREADDVATLRLRLRQAGFRVISATNTTKAQSQQAAARFVAQAPDAERLLVVLQGRFVKTDRDWFLMPVGTRERGGLMRVTDRGLSAAVLMGVLDDHPRERAVMVLGTGRELGRISPFLERGLIDLSGDQGHVLIGGAADVAGEFARDVLAVPGRSFDVAAVNRRGLAISGLTGPPMTFIPAGRELIPAAEVERQDRRRAARRAERERERRAEREGEGREAREGDVPSADREAWEAARSRDAERAYVGYLDRFPDGAFAEEAAQRLDAVRRDPERRARQGEDELNLGREDRRRIQTALSVLGHDPRGIDGIFGPGTRAAVAQWQRANGLDPAGYLSAGQLALLTDQAGRRAAEIEAEARAQRAEARRQDEAYWSQTGEGGRPAGLRAYLERYPDGIHADRARDRLVAQEREARGSAALADAGDWDEARRRDDVGAYRRYIERNPDGAFVEAARGRIGELRGRAPDPEREAAARAAEDALGLTPITRGLVEGRLEAFGFEPGQVDGRFDAETRRAIRRYQRSRNLPPTGFLDQGVAVRLLADSILR